MEIVQIPGFSEPFSSITHLLGAVAFFIGGVFCIYKGRGNSQRMIALGLYTFSLVFLFSMSGVYHLLEPHHTPRYVLRHLDYAGIWILIAGSFVPIHIILFRGKKRWGVLGPVMLVAIVGLTLQMVFFDSFPEWLTLSLFLALGWMGAYTLWMLRAHYPGLNYGFVIYGGIAYSLGAILEFSRWPWLINGVIGPHEVFHIFVLIGAGIQWLFIFDICDKPTSLVLVVQIKEYLKSGKYIAKGVNESIHIEGFSHEEVYVQLKEWVDDYYHKTMQPDEVIIKHVKVLN